MNESIITLPILDMSGPVFTSSVEKAISLMISLKVRSVDFIAHAASQSGDPSAEAVRDTMLGSISSMRCDQRQAFVPNLRHHVGRWFGLCPKTLSAEPHWSLKNE